MAKELKIAIVSDWLTSLGGAEKVLQAMTEIWPKADIYTSVYNRDNFPFLKNRNVFTTWLNKLPFKNKHQLFVYFRPMAFESLDLSKYDIVISATSAEAKNIITKPETLHVCYCHTPTRYYWSDYHEYLNNRMEFGWLNIFAKFLMPVLVNGLRQQDRLAAKRVDSFIANSKYVAKRIAKYYRRNSKVIYPPVEELGNNDFAQDNKNDYYLYVSRLVPYKKADLVVEAFKINKKKLVVVGEGALKNKLIKESKAFDNIIIKKEYVNDEEKINLLRGCKAFVFPVCEDFGIVPVEAMSCGKPVVALGEGGVRETVVDGVTGVFFDKQNIESLNRAIEIVERSKFDRMKITEHARKFSKERFKSQLKSFVENEYFNHIQ